jgi:hypothetical protein
MYHALVRRVCALFDPVSHGNGEPVLEGFAPEFEHCFLDDTALGGLETNALGDPARV